jgi:hypothetical protein
MIAKVKRKKGKTIIRFPDRKITLNLSVKQHQELNRLHWRRKDGLKLKDLVKFL